MIINYGLFILTNSRPCPPGVFSADQAAGPVPRPQSFVPNYNTKEKVTINYNVKDHKEARQKNTIFGIL